MYACICIYIDTYLYIYTYTHTQAYIRDTQIYLDMLCVRYLSVHLTSYMSTFFRLLFSNEVACAAPKTVIHFLSKVAILFA